MPFKTYYKTIDTPEAPVERSFRTSIKSLCAHLTAADSDRTVLRRSEPSSCSALKVVGQTNPWYSFVTGQRKADIEVPSDPSNGMH